MDHDVMAEASPRGSRKRLYTPEERKAARARARKASKAKTKNVTVDNDVQEQINDIQDRLEKRLGFRPSISQSLRFVFRHIDVEKMTI